MYAFVYILRLYFEKMFFSLYKLYHFRNGMSMVFEKITFFISKNFLDVKIITDKYGRKIHK